MKQKINGIWIPEEIWELEDLNPEDATLIITGG